LVDTTDDVGRESTSIAVDGSGRIHIAYNRREQDTNAMGQVTSTEFYLRTMHRPPGVTTWTRGIFDPEGYESGRQAAVKVGPDGAIYVVSFDEDGDDLRLRSRCP
jgi:hypothetical protein